MRLLNHAAKLAFDTKDIGKNFRLACIAKRKDGAFVYATNSMVREPANTGHAEARVLRKAGFGSTLWIARVLRNGSWAMAQPCVKCRSLIINKNVKQIYYTIGPNEWASWKP